MCIDDKSALIEEVGAMVKIEHNFLDSISFGEPSGGSDWKLTEREIAEPSKNVRDISILMIGM